MNLRRCRSIANIAIVFLLFLGMTGFKTYPLIWQPSTHIPSDLGDPLFSTWILAWDFHALTTAPWNLFNGNILFPLKNVLALSEHLIGLLPIFAPVYAATGNPVLAYNIVLFLSFVLCGMSMFLLVHYWTRNFWASLISGCLFAFAPARFGQLYHLPLLNLYWTPLALLFLERFLRKTSWGNLVAFAICYWMQVISSVYLGWFATIVIAIYVLYHVIIINRGLLSPSMIPQFLTFIISTSVIIIPLHFPYYQLKHQWGFSRSIGECIYYSADPLLSYLNVPPLMNDLYGSLFRFAQTRFANGEKQLSPGFVMLSLAVLGSLPIYRTLNIDKLKQIKKIFLLILISSFILSLGPFLVVFDKNTNIPLPYWLLYHLVPGFSAMRVPARSGLMLMLAASVLAGFGFLRCCELLNARFRLQRLGRWCCQLGIAVLCLGLFMLELGFKPFPLVWIQTAQEVPAVYRWLATQPPSGAILELPFGHAEDYQYTYFSTYHWLPIVNGRSGFIPPTYVQLTSELNALPSQPVIHSLSAVGVRWIVVHTDRLNSDEVLSWGTKRFVDAGLEVVAEFGSDVVYKVPPVHSTAELQLKLAVPDRLPAAKQLRLGLLAAGKGSEFWTIQPPSGNTSARIEWEELSTGKISLAAQRVQLPLLIKAGNLEQIGVEVRTPSSPGEYLLRVHLPMLGNSFVSKRVGISMDAFPTSRDSPHLLAATYALEETAPGVVTSEQVELSLRVTNTGEATWLATSKRNHGAVRLGWRWFKGDHEIPSTDGRAKLRYDISPGMAYLFEPKIPTPQEPGKYSLELGLVSDHVTWFHEQGVESVKLSILVPSRP